MFAGSVTDLMGFGSGRSLIQAITWHFPGVTKDNHDKPIMLGSDLPKIRKRHLLKALLMRCSIHPALSSQKAKWTDNSSMGCDAT
jgi:hypothetical protein